MRRDALLLLGQAKRLAAERDAFHQERHVPRKRPHGLQALGVHRRLARSPAVDAVPILARGDGHTGNGEVFVQLVKGRRAAAAPRAQAPAYAPADAGFTQVDDDELPF